MLRWTGHKRSHYCRLRLLGYWAIGLSDDAQNFALKKWAKISVVLKEIKRTRRTSSFLVQFRSLISQNHISEAQWKHDKKWTLNFPSKSNAKFCNVSWKLRDSKRANMTVCKRNNHRWLRPFAESEIQLVVHLFKQWIKRAINFICETSAEITSCCDHGEVIMPSRLLTDADDRYQHCASF